jgi:hypothetical protein
MRHSAVVVVDHAQVQIADFVARRPRKNQQHHYRKHENHFWHKRMPYDLPELFF